MKTLFKSMLAVIASATIATSAYAQTGDSKEATKSESKETAEANKTPAVVIMHYAIATETGCWATFYDDENFKGASVTLTSRTELPDVEFNLKPYRFGGEPDSVIVGPEATLRLFGDEGFKDLDHSFLAGERIANLSQKPFWDDIDSVKLICSGSKAK